MNKNKPIARLSMVVVQQLPNQETLVYDLNINKAVSLNDTSSMVWQNCNGKNDAAKIADILSSKTKTLVSEEFVEFALNELKKVNLIDDYEVETSSIKGLNRRQIVKRIGLATMIALPVISSVIAPNAVNAGSCIPLATPVLCDTGLTSCLSVLPGSVVCQNTNCCDGFCLVDNGIAPSGNCSRADGTYI